MGKLNVADGINSLDNVKAPRISIGADYGSTYPVAISTGQRYCIGFRNTGATNGSTNYPWLAHESNKLILHWNSIGDRFSIDHSGTVVASGNVTAYSDEKLKENIEVIDNAVEKVKQIRGVTFTRNDLEDKEKRYTGVIAQEIEKVLPEVVSYDEGQDAKTVAYGNIVGLLIEAVKEQQEQIEELKSIINTLVESK